MNRETIQIDISNITINNTLRNGMGDLSSQENSIQKLGLLNPVIIDRNNALISGSRRLQACLNAGITQVTAIKFDIDANDMTAVEIQSDENHCREQLSAEELEALIKRKMAIMNGKSPTEGKGIMSWLKNLFGG